MSRLIRFAPVAVAVLLLAAWEFGVRAAAVPQFILPAPSVVALRFAVAWSDGTMLRHLVPTIQELVIGGVIGGAVGLLIGIVLGISGAARRIASPYLVAAQSTPLLALGPLFVIWFGPGAAAKIAICAIISLFPLAISTLVAVREAAKTGRNVVIFDTAGRLAIDEALMDELERIDRTVGPDQCYLVVDAMTGQDAVRSAKAFNDRLHLDGVIMTKLDGDARGGAALSVKSVTGVPIKFIGTGEKVEALQPFHPERMASRILTSMCQPWHVQSAVFRLSASIGVAIADDGVALAEERLAQRFVVAPIDGTALGEVLQKAGGAGVKVLAYERPVRS